MNEDDYTPPALETLLETVSDLVRAGFPPGLPPGRRAVLAFAAVRALHRYPLAVTAGTLPTRVAVHGSLVSEEDRARELVRRLEADAISAAAEHRQDRIRALRRQLEEHERIRAFEVALAAFLVPWHPPEGSYADGVRGQIGWAMAEHLGTPSSLGDQIRHWEERPDAEIAEEMLRDARARLAEAVANLEAARKGVDGINARLAELEASLPEDTAP